MIVDLFDVRLSVCSSCLRPVICDTGSDPFNKSYTCLCAKLKEISKTIQKQRLDLDKNCGVIISSTGRPCLRSLTCKSHSLTSKRKVEGRSKPLDELLRERNALILKKNLAEQGDIPSKSLDGNLMNSFELLEFKERPEQHYPTRFRALRRQLIYHLKKPLSGCL